MRDYRSIQSLDWGMKLGEAGEVVEGIEDVRQCVRVILKTPRGSVPFRPKFGIDWTRYLSKPLQTVRVALVQEIKETLAQHEPRFVIERITVSDFGLGQIRVKIIGTVNGQSVSETIIS